MALLLELRRRASGGHGLSLHRPGILGAETEALSDGGGGGPGGGPPWSAALAGGQVDIPVARRASAGEADLVPRGQAAVPGERREARRLEGRGSALRGREGDDRVELWPAPAPAGIGLQGLQAAGADAREIARSSQRVDGSDPVGETRALRVRLLGPVGGDGTSGQ